ncbi:polyprenyl synthetase family protein [Vreelandella populi]|uniref:Polyprenyl synthetase family protein n=1 Tax=Vreelandella populi TaxID=2498858 RepID=A0A3S1E5Y6_9GAMM|nr:polyprenyl synthetase family protein [Halomonas populi]RUR36939.1 polyprenyl synthetase family protein [Halomonas populi]RUR44090.1 polyprenyl synthetase family protein [Halomonas populi]
MNASVDTLSSYEDELQALRDALQTRLAQLLPEGHEHDLVCAAMREGTLVPGKRIRPLLLILAAQDLGCKLGQPGLLDLACAIEMVHAASLILDDIPCMDNALLRRGKPTIHRQFGENVAILAAVALLSRAFGVVAEAEGLRDVCKTEAAAELSRAAGLQGLVQGQFRDLSEGSQPRSAEAILSTNTLKTSTLFEATLQMAALAAGASTEVRQTLRCFAQDLGQAFQLLDDLSDGCSTTGKDINKDSGKSTLVAILGPEEVHQRLQEHLSSADEHLLHACGQKAVTRHFMRRWFEKQLTMFS